jgi:hypothetical protein
LLQQLDKIIDTLTAVSKSAEKPSIATFAVFNGALDGIRPVAPGTRAGAGRRRNCAQLQYNVSPFLGNQ